MTTTEFAEQFELSEVFVSRLKELYELLAISGISPAEYSEYREKSERFTSNVMRRLNITDKTILGGML